MSKSTKRVFFIDCASSPSRNVTIQDSPGFTKKDDPVYTNLPPDSRKHPAPIDPSSKVDFMAFELLYANLSAVSKLFYVSSTKV